MNKLDEVADFLFEIGTLRKLPRSHRQLLLTEDATDNISSHSFRVIWIGWLLAKLEKCNSDKVVMMCLLHDLPETRSNDQNWVHKSYVKVFEDEIIKDQLKDLPEEQELEEIYREYEERESLEAKVAKDADVLDQLLLLKEHMHAGNKEAESWLHLDDFENKSRQFGSLHTDSARKLAKKIVESRVSGWWKSKWTQKRR